MLGNPKTGRCGLGGLLGAGSVLLQTHTHLTRTARARGNRPDLDVDLPEGFRL
jgi:hypothetical protein